MQTPSRPKFEIGMTVHCSTTYGKFTGRICRPCIQLSTDPGPSFVVSDLADGKEYAVSVFSMKSVTEGSSAPTPSDDRDSSLEDTPLYISTLPPRDRAYLEWFADQCAQYGCD